MTDEPLSTGTVLRHERGDVFLEPLGGGRTRVSVKLAGGAFTPRATCETTYPQSLIQHILDRKGPAYLCDEIARDQDPSYTEATLKPDLLAFVSAADFEGKRLLDFGCGSGASTMILARLFPKTEIVGVELSEELLETARLRAEHYGLPNLRFLKSPSGDSLPPELGQVDFIVLSAVFEHLLPNERLALMPMLWAALKPGGVMFIDQTPHRWFPIEHHTTYLPLLNYLPKGLAHRAALRFSRLVVGKPEWPKLLRDGIRGGTASEVLHCLSDVPGGPPIRLKPRMLPGVKDEVDLWLAGSTFRNYPRARKWVWASAKALHLVTRRAVVPYISVALKKPT